MGAYAAQFLLRNANIHHHHMEAKDVLLHVESQAGQKRHYLQHVAKHMQGFIGGSADQVIRRDGNDAREGFGSLVRQVQGNVPSITVSNHIRLVNALRLAKPDDIPADLFDGNFLVG